MSAYTDHIADPLRESIWLVEIATTQKNDGSAATLRYSSHPFSTSTGDSPASTLYASRLTEPLNFVLEAEDPDATGQGALRGGVIKLGQVSGDLDTLPDTYHLQGSTVTVKLGGYTPSTGVTMAFADYGVVAVLEVDSVELTRDELQIGVSDKSQRLDDRMERRYYGGRDWCGRFDNGSSYFDNVDYGAPAKADITGDLTVMAWLYCDSLQKGMRIAAWDSGASAYPFSIAVDSSGRINYLDSTQTATFAVGNAIVAHRWYHVAVTRDSAAGSASLCLYDLTTGAESTETITGLTLPAPANSGGTLQVGNNWRGLLSCVQILDDNLSQRQVINNRWSVWDSSHPLWSNLKLYATLNETTSDSSDSPATPSTTGTATYVPTCDGDESLDGSPVPVVYGKVRNITPALVDARRLIYQVADLGADVASVAAYEGGYPLGAGSARTNLIDLLTTAPWSTQYDWHLSNNGAFIRLGSNPSKPVTADVTMTNTAIDDVLTDLLTERGTDPFKGGDLDISLTDTPAVGYYSDGSRATIREAVEYLLSVLGSYWIDRAGSFVARTLFDPSTGTPVATLDETSIISWREIERSEPLWQYGILCRRNWTPLEGEALNALLVGTASEPFFRRPWNFARARDRDVLGDYPRAGMVDHETVIDLRTDALPIAEDRLDLFDSPSRTIQIVAKLSGLSIGRFDVVTLDIGEPDRNGSEVTRIDGDWIALGVEESAGTNTLTLTLWRPE